MYETIDSMLALAALIVVARDCGRQLRRRRFGPPVHNAPRAPGMREDAVIAAILAYLAGAIALTGVAHLVFSDPEDVRFRLIVGNGAHLVGAFACLLIGAWRFDGGLKRFLLGGPARSHGQTLLALMAPAILAVGLCPLVRDATVIAVRYFSEAYAFPAHPTILALDAAALAPTVKVALWIGAIAVAPLAEEAFFRGMVQTFLLNAFGSRRLAVLFSSLAFGFIHFQQPHAIPALVVLGIVLGFAYERTGAMMAPFLIHALFNLKTLLWYAAATT